MTAGTRKELQGSGLSDQGEYILIWLLRSRISALSVQVGFANQGPRIPRPWDKSSRLHIFFAIAAMDWIITHIIHVNEHSNSIHPHLIS